MGNILSAMKVGVTTTYYNQKCVEYGATYNDKLINTNKEDSSVLKHKHNVILVESMQAAVGLNGQSSDKVIEKDLSSDIDVCGSEPDVPDPSFIDAMKQSDSPTNAVNNMETDVSNELSPGFKFPFDNFDIHQNVRNMTEENQNKDLHWVNHNAVKNRVSGNHLPNNVPICDIKELDNAKLLPNSMDNILQRENYIKLVGRVITQEIPYLNFCEDTFPQHISHAHSEEMAKKSEKISICVTCTVFI